MCEGIEKTSCELDFETIARSSRTALALHYFILFFEKRILKKLKFEKKREFCEV
jgi:hypothetical protein